MVVERVRWPAESARLEQLRADGVPRLLLCDGGAPPPAPSDCLEDWAPALAAADEIEARVAALAARAARHGARPVVDDDGRIRHRDVWVALSPVEQALADALVSHFDRVVSRDELGERAWPAGLPTRNALDVHVLRLRRRIAPLGLEIRTVRGRGYVLGSAI